MRKTADRNSKLSRKERRLVKEKIEEIKNRRKVIWRFNDESIDEIKEIIQKGVENKQTADRFYKLLALECGLYSFGGVFKAGKDCYGQKKPWRQGLHDYLAQENQKTEYTTFQKEFNQTYTFLRYAVSDKRVLYNLEYLPLLYRNSNNLNSDLEEFFCRDIGKSADNPRGDSGYIKAAHAHADDLMPYLPCVFSAFLFLRSSIFMLLILNITASIIGISIQFLKSA